MSIFVSAAALVVSIATAWLTLFRRGTLKMTRPAVVYFGADGPLTPGERIPRKVHLRSLMYSTGKRGCVVESMYVTLHRGESRQTFNIWVYGDEKLSRGSGLFVGEPGVVCNHHFLLPADGTQFQFLAGEYQLDVFASLVGHAVPQNLCSIKLALPDALARELQTPENGVYFDWGPDSGQYFVHVKKSPYTKV
ncbi:MAG TPA: hypothetical protein VNZ27_06335 [Rhodanobacter sp.]|nr:hypothetical protein [Rhodanobacter sp.]